MRGLLAGVESQQVGVEGASEVEALMGRVADEAGVEISAELKAAPEGEVQQQEAPDKERARMEEGLGDRLRALRN